MKHYIVNMDKYEYLSPAMFGESDSLRSMGMTGGGVMYGLAYLLGEKPTKFQDGALGNPRNFNIHYDINESSSKAGSWAGDRVIIANAGSHRNDIITPYYKKQLAKFLAIEIPTYERYGVYGFAQRYFHNISEMIIDALVHVETVARGNWDYPLALMDRPEADVLLPPARLNRHNPSCFEYVQTDLLNEQDGQAYDYQEENDEETQLQQRVPVHQVVLDDYLELSSSMRRKYTMD